MPVSIEFLRGMLGILCIFFAYMLGRAAAGLRQGKVRRSRLYGWLFRTIVTAFAIAWRHGLDAVMIGVILLAVLACGLGVWAQSRPRQSEEDLSRQIFPE